jgi:hypothetical protein
MSKRRKRDPEEIPLEESVLEETAADEKRETA